MKKIIIPIVVVIIIISLSLSCFAEDITQNIAFVKIYRYSQQNNNYSWINTDYEIDESGNITTTDDPNAFQREMLDFIFPAKTVNDVTFSYTIRVDAITNPSVTSTAGSMRLRFDGTNVATKTVRGTYKIQSGVCIYQVNTVRFEFETPITIDEIDITSYITSVSASISFQNVQLIINDESYTFKEEINERVSSISSDIESAANDADSAIINGGGIANRYAGAGRDIESRIDYHMDDIESDIERYISQPVEDIVNIYVYQNQNGETVTKSILEHPMFIIFTLVPCFALISYIIFGEAHS